MTNIPFYLRKARYGYRMGHGELEDGLITALSDPFTRSHMGITAENVANQYNVTIIFALNFFASVKIAEALRPLLKKKKGNCVVTSSNSITNMTVRMDWVDMLSNVMDEERVLEFVKDIPRTQAASCYSSSKHALARWVRRVSPSWAVDGLRINSVAPGNTTTPMTQNMTDAQMESALLIPIPTRYGRKEFLDAEEIANGITFLASPMASGINGVILFVDGGIDALLRSERF